MNKKYEENTVQKEQQKLVELLHNFRAGMLSTITKEGLIRARPMGLLEVTDNAEVWFATRKDNDLATDIKRDARVNLTLQEGGAYLSLAGMAELVESQEKIDEKWEPIMRQWFPEGKDSDEILLIRLVPFEGEFWDMTGLNRVKFFFEQVKAVLKGEVPDASALNTRVEL